MQRACDPLKSILALCWRKACESRCCVFPKDLIQMSIFSNMAQRRIASCWTARNPFFLGRAGRAREKFDMQTAEGRADAFKYIAPALQHVHDRVERGAIANELAEYLNVDRQTIRENLARPTVVQPQRSRSLPATIPPNDKLLLACLLASRDARLAIKQYLLQSNTLPLLELKNIFEAVLAVDEAGDGFSMERVSERLDDRMRKILAELTFSD